MSHERGMKRFGAVFLLCALVLFFFASTLIFAKARVIILSRPEEVTASLTVKVSRNPGEGEVRGDVFVLEDTYTQTFPAAQGAENPTGKAEGRVRITSTLTRPQVLIATTRLLTSDGTLFRLKEAVTVPAQGSVEANVVADQPGPRGAITSATFTIPGLNADSQKFFVAVNTAPFTLPVDTSSGGVTQEVVNAAISALKAQANEKLTERLEAFAQTAGTAYAGKAFSFVTIKDESSPAIGSEAKEFTETLVVRGTAVYYDQEGFEKVLSEGLREEIPFGRALGRLVPEASQATVEKIDASQGNGTLKVKTQGTMVISNELPALARKQFSGVTVDAAKRYAERVEGIASVSIKVWPPWQTRLPEDPERIIVEVR